MNKRFTLGLLFCFNALAFAQTNDEGLALLQWNFSTPGARGLGMGGTFIAVADDVTAAAGNPAGLTVLSRPEAAVEFSLTSFQNEIPWNAGLQTSSFDGTTFSLFQNEFLPRDFPERTQNVAFAGVVFPIPSKKFVLAAFYHQPTNFEREFETEGFDIQSCDQQTNQCSGGKFFFPTSNSLVARISDVGLTGAFKLSESISFGAGLDYWKLHVDSETRRIDRAEGRLQNTQTLDANSSSFSYRLGMLWEAGSEFRFAATYIQRPSFSSVSTNQDLVFGDQVTDQKLEMPDSFSAGASWQLNEKTLLNVEIVRIFSSQLMEGYYNAFFHQGALDLFPTNQLATPNFQGSTLEVDDGTEFHLGGEYSLFMKNLPINLRAGYWYEPFQGTIQTLEDDQLQQVINSDGLILNDTLATPFTSRTLSKGVHHFTIGSGFIWEEFSVDWAVDLSRNSKRLAVTTLLYF